ncbi:hypothetical protein CDL15_Pgr025332 [Punica granatum]|uniref:At1g61320/AtMIF1 LRR domain-containing protein n=1 Tax=Punica granatum TaxID=22663 RepID=A0A218W8M6_PUNGR|nr:hypothetical protein CDL15_Pgr025332 [Punica granatum]
MKRSLNHPMNRGVERHKYICWVNQVIAASRGRALNYLDKFRVHFYLDARHSHEVCSWVQFALEKGAQHLELNCFQGNGSKKRRNCSFPMLQPGPLSSIGQLKSVSLNQVSIDSEKLDRLLSTCKSLETLRVSWSHALTHLEVVSPDPLQLKSLELSFCSKLETVVITAPTPDLVSLHCHGSERGVTKLHLKCAPRLVDLLIGGCRDIARLAPQPSLSFYLAQLESLSVTLQRKIYPRVPDGIFWRLPEMKNLKHLTVLVDDKNYYYKDLYDVNFLIRKAPFLEHLTVHARCCMQFQDARRRKLKPKHPLQHLRMAKYVGFRGFRGDEQLILHLLQTAVSPEKLIIDFQDPMPL